jgi:hypothetical protein
MERDILDEGLIAFSEVHVVPDFESGVLGVAQANGIGGLRANTVMFGWSRRRERLASHLRIMRALARAGRSTIIARINWSHEPGQRKKIDLWWGGLEHNGDLMLLLAYLLRLNPEWSDARLTVRSVARSDAERDSQIEGLAALLPETRIHAETEVILTSPDQDIAELIHRHSSSADVVLLGLMEPEEGTEDEYAARLRHLAEGLNTTIFVRNAGDFAGSLI